MSINLRKLIAICVFVGIIMVIAISAIFFSVQGIFAYVAVSSGK